MKKTVLIVSVLLLSFTLVAATLTPKPVNPGTGKIKPLKPADKGSAIIDYFYNVRFFFTDDFYLSNVFKPEPGWYPFQVTKLYILPYYLDGVTSGQGIINRIRVWVPGGSKGAVDTVYQFANVPATVYTWNTLTLGTPPTILTGNFYAGMWNSGTTATVGDHGLIGTATGWTAPPKEPFQIITGPTTSAATTGWTAFTWGQTAYTTLFAAAIAAEVTGDSVPVELMEFSAE